MKQRHVSAKAAVRFESWKRCEGTKRLLSCKSSSLRRINIAGRCGGTIYARSYGTGSRTWFHEQLQGAGAVQYATIGFTMGTKKGKGNTFFS